MKTDTFSSELLSWYQKHQRSLPWRETHDPYKIWVSEVMLQQTTVNTVIAYYKRFIKTFPTIQALARAPYQSVLKEWQGLGYYRRAKNMHLAAAILMKEHKGRIPKEPHILRSLPGFGAYTTGAVSSIAYNLPLGIIDANIRRVCMRLLKLEAKADGTQDKTINVFLNKVMPANAAGDFNQALMELGALVCRSQVPQCHLCPVVKHCEAYKKKKQDSIPWRGKKVIKNIKAVLAVIKENNRYFIQKRPSDGLWADLWEFPGGKIKPGESKQQALRRELKEELNIQCKSMQPLCEIKHFYTQFKVHLSVFECVIDGQAPLDKTHRWIPYKDFSLYPMPSANKKIIAKFKRP